MGAAWWSSELGEPFEQTVLRELAEETGLRATVDGLIGARAFEVTPGAWVDLVAYRVTAGGGPLTPSDEHVELAHLDPETLTDAELDPVYRELATGAVSPGLLGAVSG